MIDIDCRVVPILSGLLAMTDEISRMQAVPKYITRESDIKVDIARQIAEKASELFDVFGVSRRADGRYIMVLGLESAPERNLDDFGHSEGVFRMYGFEKHIAPRLESLLQFIRDRGFSAEPTGRLGYPLRGEINLKELAIRTGIGRRGKNTVVLHPDYGPRLRFTGVLTNAPLDALAGEELEDREAPACSRCSICIDECPVNVLEPYRMIDPTACLSNITPKTDEGRSILCDICLKRCPA
jgi:ferredoxin